MVSAFIKFFKFTIRNDVQFMDSKLRFRNQHKARFSTELPFSKRLSNFVNKMNSPRNMNLWTIKNNAIRGPIGAASWPDTSKWQFAIEIALAHTKQNEGKNIFYRGYGTAVYHRSDESVGERAARQPLNLTRFLVTVHNNFLVTVHNNNEMRFGFFPKADKMCISWSTVRMWRCGAALGSWLPRQKIPEKRQKTFPILCKGSDFIYMIFPRGRDRDFIYTNFWKTILMKMEIF